MMKRFLLFGMIFLAGLIAYSQECGNYIEMIGIGTADSSEHATLLVPGYEEIDFIVAEAIYKAADAPEAVIFRTAGEEVSADPVPVTIHGGDASAWYPTVFRAELDPAPAVELDFGDNIDAFFSFVLYLHMQDGDVYTIESGELYHVWENGTAPLVQEIAVPFSPDARDILLRFGITELDDDERWAVFTFTANGVEVIKEIQTWDQDGGTDSYLVQSVLFENVPGDVDMITMEMFSADPGGDSFIAGIVLMDLPCEEYEPHLLCSFTQGFYGNVGGKTCAGLTTMELLDILLEEPIVMGGNGNTFTIAAGASQCVIDILPGGGPSSVLEGEAVCSDPETYDHNKQGRLRNTLLAQGITLALNVRLSPDLLAFPVDGTMFVTRAVDDCTDPEAGGIPGTEMLHAFGQDVADYLGEDATIGDLLELVNMALAGEDIYPLNLSQVGDAAAMVNEAFDECVVVLEGENAEAYTEGESEGEGDGEGSRKGITATQRYRWADQIGVYPNPARSHLFVQIPGDIPRVHRAGIYSITGTLIRSVDYQFESGYDQVVEIGTGDLLKGFYFIKLETDQGSVMKQFGVQ